MIATVNREEPVWVWPSPAASSACTVERSAPETPNHTASKSKSSCPLPGLLDLRIHRNAPALIAGGADCEARRNLVLPLDGLILRRSHVTGKRDKEISRDPLLDGDIRARRSLAGSTSQHWIDGKLGDACNLRDPAGHLAAYLRCHQRRGRLVCWSRILGVRLGGGTECQQVDDVRGGQRRVR